MPNPHPAKVLVVDDDPDCRWLITHALDEAGYIPIPVSAPEDALSRALEEDVEAAFLDIEMPGLSGLNVLEMLRHDPWLSDLLVIMVSARAGETDRVEGLRCGADDYVVKPFCPEELILRLQRHLRRGLRRKRSPTAPLLRQALCAGSLREAVPVGRYIARDILGRGASGLVLRATDPQLQRVVAIKLLGRPRRDGESKVDLGQEAATLAGFDHPNIVKVFDAGHVEDLPYLVMEWVDGESLDRRLQRGPLPVDEVVDLGLALCRALGAAHKAGWIHRDLKPANIMLTADGSTKLTDFGVASLVDHRADPGWIAGTPGYTPPECLLGEPHDEAGDLFSLGVVLYQALTGSKPFARANLSETLLQTLAGRHASLDETAPDVPLPLRRLIHQLLDRFPAGRPASAGHVERRLIWIQQALANPLVDLEDADPADTLPIPIAH